MFDKKIQKEYEKFLLNAPIYKPIKVSNEKIGVDMNDDLLNTCHLIHKSMIAVLDINYKHLEVKTEMDDMAKHNHDYIAAMFLHTYFTTWLNDVNEIHKMTDGGE